MYVGTSMYSFLFFYRTQCCIDRDDGVSRTFESELNQYSGEYGEKIEEVIEDDIEGTKR